MYLLMSKKLETVKTEWAYQQNVIDVISEYEKIKSYSCKKKSEFLLTTNEFQ